MTSQQAKEAAIKTALTLGYALFRRGLMVVAVDAKGTEKALCVARGYDALWEEAAYAVAFGVLSYHASTENHSQMPPL